MDDERDTGSTAKLLRGLLAGAIAGAVASFAMDRFQAAVQMSSSSGDDAEPATQQAADAVSAALTGDPLPEADKPLGGQAVHYALGIGLGAAYGIAAEFRPGVTAGYGSGFAMSTATLLDEAAVPAVGLGNAPWRADAGTALYAYASHLVFGIVTEFVRRQVAATLQPKHS